MVSDRSDNTSPSTRVLVVDDDEDIRLAARDVLEWAGMEVATAEDGLAALEHLARGPHPHVIVLDLMMPRMNGFEFLARLRESPELKGLPVVVVSANQGYPADEMKVVRMLRKPMSIEVLLAAIREALQTDAEHRARLA